MASSGAVPCIGDKCNKMVYVEPNEPPLCQLHAKAVLNTQAVAKSKDRVATTKAQQQQVRYSDQKWQKEMKRRKENKVREDNRARDAELAAAARRPLPPPVHGHRFGTNRLFGVSGSGSSSRHSSATGRPMPDNVYSTISRAVGSRMSAPSGPRRFSRDSSVDLGNKVSKTGRVRQAGFIVEDDDDLPVNPIGSMAPPSRPQTHNEDKYNKENRRHYNYYDNSDDLPQSAINFKMLLSRPNKERHGIQKQTERELDDLAGLRLNGAYSAHARKTSRLEPRYNGDGGLVDSEEELEPVGHEEIRRSMNGRSKRASHSSQSKAQLRLNKLRDTKRRNEDPEPQRRTKRTRFTSNVLAELGQAEEVPPPKKSYPVPKTVKAMLPRLEIFEDADPTAQFTVAKSESLGVPDDDSALVQDVESETESESVMSEKTLPLEHKMRLWLGDNVNRDEEKSNPRVRAEVPKPAPAAQSVAQTEATLTRFQRGMRKNRVAPSVYSVAQNQPQIHLNRQPTRPQPVLSESESERRLPRVFLPRYQPSIVDLMPSYMLSDAGDSDSSTSCEEASAHSVARNSDGDALALLQELPNAIKRETLKRTTPQKSSKENIEDKELLNFTMDYPLDSDTADLDTQGFDSLVSMDSAGSIMVEHAPFPGGLSGISGVRAIKGLSADSTINGQIILDPATRAQDSTLVESIPPANGQTQENDEEAQIEHQLMMEDFESKKKKYEDEKEKLTKMTEASENVSKQKMVVKLVAKKLDGFVAQNGLQYRRERMVFE